MQNYKNNKCTPSFFPIYSKLFFVFTLLNFCKNCAPPNHRPHESIICVHLCHLCDTPFCRAKHFCAFCDFRVTFKQNVKQFQDYYFRPKIPVFQPISASWTFPRGNLDFPLTKLPLSPNETSRFPRALSAFYLHI